MTTEHRPSANPSETVFSVVRRVMVRASRWGEERLQIASKILEGPERIAELEGRLARSEATAGHARQQADHLIQECKRLVRSLDVESSRVGDWQSIAVSNAAKAAKLIRVVEQVDEGLNSVILELRSTQKDSVTISSEVLSELSRLLDLCAVAR